MTVTTMGIRVAVEGMKTSCGATLIASQFTDTISSDAGSSSGSPVSPARAPADNGASAGATASAAAPAASDDKDPETFDDHYVLIDDETGEVLAHTEYAIVRASGEVEHGVTDEHGKTHLLSSTLAAEDIDIYA